MDFANCPLPKFDYDTINLGHGSGGLLTHRLLQSFVFDVFGNDKLDQQHDGATFHLNGPVAFSTDSYVVSPLFFPGGNIGDLAINGTVNDLAMCGAAAKYLSLGFIIEEGLKMEAFWSILQTIRAAAANAGVQIVTGDTKVVEKGKGDGIFINTSGIGIVHPKARIHHRNIKEGDAIVISGKLAAHGMAIMSLREGLSFDTTIVSDTRNLNHVVANMLDRFGEGIRFLRDPTRGGLASVLNEVAGQTTLGLSISQSAIPIDEEVDGACEMLGFDPLYVANEGIFACVADATIADELLNFLQGEEATREAALIGKVTAEHPGKVIMQSRIGGKRVVNYLTGEQLPRIC